jgi:hypothetical protein
MGVTLVGQGFVVEPGDELLQKEPGALRRYLVGNELNRKPRNRFVIDFFGLDAQQAQDLFPASFQRLIDRVKPERIAKAHSKDGAVYAQLWWLFGKPRPSMREALNRLDRYIAICRTAKHFVFSFVGNDTLVS